MLLWINQKLRDTIVKRLMEAKRCDYEMRNRKKICDYKWETEIMICDNQKRNRSEEM